MGLFDSIRRVVGGGDGTAASDDAATQPDLVDTRDLDVAALRERASGVAGEVDVLDFSLDSLAQFDDAIDAGYDEDLATSDEPGAYATDTVRFGCYLGGVLVRAYDGEWTQNPDWGVTITGPDGDTTVAVFDVAERSITTGAVFEAVADRAAVEVGLDGPPAADAVTDDAADGETDTESSGQAAAEESTVEDDPTDEGPRETTGAVEPPGEDRSAEPTDEPPADTPEAPADPSSAETAPSAAARETVDRAVDESDTESLIEEAEPGSTTDDAPADEPDPSAEPAGDAPEPDSQSDTSSATPEASESLFGDDTAGAGPSLDDAPAAADGPSTPLSDAEADATADDPGAVAPDDTPDAGADGDGTADSVGAATDSGDAAGDSAGPDPTAGDDLRATYAEAAEELVSFWTEYDLDYTPDSLDRLDALVSEEWDDDRFDDADFGSDDSFDDRVFTSVSTELGSYFGEVLVRELDAEWRDEATTDGVVVEGADGPLAIPVFKVAGTSITQQPVFARSYDSLLSDLEQ